MVFAIAKKNKSKNKEQSRDNLPSGLFFNERNKKGQKYILAFRRWIGARREKEVRLSIR